MSGFVFCFLIIKRMKKIPPPTNVNLYLLFAWLLLLLWLCVHCQLRRCSFDSLLLLSDNFFFS